MERDCGAITQEEYDIISTHTLTWSVTRHLHIYRLFNINFNSHAHVERDYMKHM